MVGGLTWIVTCVALAGVWAVFASWRAGVWTWTAAARGLLGGAAALGVASIGYGICELAGIDLEWQRIARDAWPAFGFAAIIGVVEEGAKLTGIVLALPSRAWRNVLQTTVAVASVFAIAEAVQALRGASWHLALSRAALGPVAHGILALPMAVALAEPARSSRLRIAWRVLIAFGFAAVLHAIGDFSVARPGWGRIGFAAALIAPTLWLYVSRRAECRVGLPRLARHP